MSCKGIEFNADPGVWTDKANTDSRLWEIVESTDKPTIEAMSAAIAEGNHIYHGIRLSDAVLLLIRYDDNTREPIRVVVNPEISQ